MGKMTGKGVKKRVSLREHVHRKTRYICRRNLFRVSGRLLRADSRWYSADRGFPCAPWPDG